MYRTGGVSNFRNRKNRNAAFLYLLLRNRGIKALAISGFAGAFLAQTGIYPCTRKIAILLRNKSAAKE